LWAPEPDWTYWSRAKPLARFETKIGKIIAAYGECQTELCEQNAGLFSVPALGTYTVFTVVLQTALFRVVKWESLTKIGIGIPYVH